MSKRKQSQRKLRWLASRPCTDSLHDRAVSDHLAKTPAALHQILFNADHIESRQLSADEVLAMPQACAQNSKAHPANIPPTPSHPTPSATTTSGMTTWMNLHGLHDAAMMQAVARRFHLHPLVVEDILNTEQRPKLDHYPAYLFLETRLFYYDRTHMTVSSEQISLALGKDWLLSVQERPSGSFEPVRQRLRQGQALIRQNGADYLCYALLDSLMERYFQVLDAIIEDAEQLETRLLEKPRPEDLHNLHRLKHVTIQLRRAVWPLREVLNTLIRNEYGFFQPQTVPYLRDVYDHSVHFTESLESIRDTLSGLMDIYMTSLSQRVNLELRALTVVAMLFMPATLIAGIFGMNFSQMPWAHDPYGFWWAVLIMLGIASLMLLVFWRRQWLSSRHV